MTQELFLENLSAEISQIIERVSPSILVVQGRRFPSSGIAWQKNLVITTDHSLPQSEEIQIRTSSGELITAVLAGRDPSTDIAILKTTTDLQPIENAADQKLKAGQLPVIVGRARGGRVLAQLTMISGTDEGYRNWRGGTFDQFIRLDTSAFPGFSGSALVLPNGKVAGMNTSIFSRHFGLTIPASNIERLVQRLSTKGYFGKPYLGVLMQPIRLSSKLQQLSGTDIGLLVMSSEESSPAEQAGLIAGDIIVRFDEKNLNSTQDIQEFLNEESIGKEIKTTIVRGGKVQELKVKIGERPLRQRKE